MIEQILEIARQLREEIPSDDFLSESDAMRADAAHLLRQAADLLGAARAAETRA
jgi:hypothetical protein